MVPRPLQKLGGDSPLVSKADPIFKTLDESPRTFQSLVVLLTVQGLVLVRLSSMYDFALMLGQLDNIPLRGLGLL